MSSLVGLAPAFSARQLGFMRLSLVGLTKKFGPQRVLDGLSLDLLPGTITCVIGLNGAGKTTLLRCCAGLLAASDGEVRYDDAPFRRDDLALRRRMCFLPDFPPFLGDATVLTHISLILDLYRPGQAFAADRVIDLLGEFDLLPYAEMPIATLSRGQTYKAALIGLLLAQPELWLLDEPFASGMDPQGLGSLKRYAREATAGGATIVYSTQILEIAERFADRIIVIDRGRVRLDLEHAALRALPPSGVGSLEDQLREFRENRA